MSRYGRRARHPHVSPEMKRRLELERRRDEAASAMEGKTDDVTETKHGGNPNLDLLEPRQTQEQDKNSVTTAVATVVEIVVDSGSRIIGQFTVPTLPATISDSSLGYFTIPSDLTAPIIVSSIPAAPETATSTPSGNSASPSPSVTPTSTRDSRLPTPSDHFFSHIPSSSRAIPSPSALFTGSSSVPLALATSASSASVSISTSGSRSSSSTIQSVLSSSSSSASSSGATSSSAQSTTSGSANGYSTSAATTGAGAGVGGSISGSGNSGQPSSGDDSNSQGSGSSSGVSTPRVVGGVVGGVAGAFFLFLLALLVLRWRKKYAHKTRGALASDHATSGAAARSESGAPNAEMMSQRSSVTPLAAAAASAGFFNRWRNSTQTVSTQDTTPSERGFQKISGRKIPSVLRTGGDGYGSGGEEEIVPGAAVSSTDLSPRPGHLATAPTIVETTTEGDEHFIPFDQYEPPLSATTTRASDVDRMDGVFMRPSPARSPVASTVNLPESGQSIPTRQVTRASSIPRRPDLIGRSHPSWDGSRGSRGSRFTESID